MATPASPLQELYDMFGSHIMNFQGVCGGTPEEQAKFWPEWPQRVATDNYKPYWTAACAASDGTAALTWILFFISVSADHHYGMYELQALLHGLVNREPARVDAIADTIGASMRRYTGPESPKITRLAGLVMQRIRTRAPFMRLLPGNVWEPYMHNLLNGS